MLELLKKFGTAPPVPGGGGGDQNTGDTGSTTAKKTENGIPNSMETSASVNSISSVGSTGSANSTGAKISQSPSLERLPSYLLRKGKKKKGAKTPVDENYKPIKVAPTNEMDDFSVPDFLKMKNIKNVVSAVNEMKRSTRRKLSGPIAEALLRKAAEMGESVPEEIAEEDEEEYDTNDDASSVDTRRQESIDSSIDGNTGYDSQQDLGRDNMGLITEEDHLEERRNSNVSRNGSARAPLRREKAFAGGESNDSKAEDCGSPESTKEKQGTEEEGGAGGSQSSSGIASPNSNNSFQSQDSTEGQNRKDKEAGEEEDPLPDDDNGASPDSGRDSGHVPDGESDMANMIKPGKRASYLWGQKNKEAEDQNVEMTTRYVYNGFQPKDE